MLKVIGSAGLKFSKSCNNSFSLCAGLLAVQYFNSRSGSAHSLLTFLGILFAFPPNYLGLLIGLGMPFMLAFRRKLSGFDWLAVAFFNVPNLIVLRGAVFNETPFSSPTYMATLGVMTCL